MFWEGGNGQKLEGRTGVGVSHMMDGKKTAILFFYLLSLESNFLSFIHHQWSSSSEDFLLARQTNESTQTDDTFPQQNEQQTRKE